MMSSTPSPTTAAARAGATPKRARKRPEERRAEILDAAARLALDEGLERITLRAVAERLGVRPGLISHYFPAADDLVAAAVVLALSGERELLFPTEGAPLERVALLVHRLECGAADELARLWLNARHLSRFIPALAAAVEEQEALDRTRMIALIDDGVASGDFAPADAYTACVRIFMAIDGFGSYVNDPVVFEHPAFTRFVSDTVCRELSLPDERLRAEIERIAR